MHQDDLPDELFAKFRALVYRSTGIRVPETKRVLLSNRLRRRMRAAGVGGFGEYYRRLITAAGAEERAHFIDAVTTRETYFFRDRHQFDWLSDALLPELSDRAARGLRPRRLAIWSAACSTGEEVYSILIRLARRPPGPGWRTDVLGTDVSEAALAAAREGRYGARSMRLVGPDDRDRYFHHDTAAARWAVRPELRRRARFARHNLLEPAPAGPWDCVFLKNVLIYFDAESKRAAVRHVVDALAPGGYLVVGGTEGVYSLLGGLARRSGWLYQRPEGDAA